MRQASRTYQLMGCVTHCLRMPIEQKKKQNRGRAKLRLAVICFSKLFPTTTVISRTTCLEPPRRDEPDEDETHRREDRNER